MVVVDSSVLIKGLIEPRRKKDDEILKEQIRIHKIAASIIEDIIKGKEKLSIPTVGLFECSCVAARITGKKDIGIETANFIFGLCSEVISEPSIREKCIDVAASTRSSGFDSLFITCTEVTDSMLITDDKGMFDAAVKHGIKAKLLRDMN